MSVYLANPELLLRVLVHGRELVDGEAAGAVSQVTHHYHRVPRRSRPEAGERMGSPTGHASKANIGEECECWLALALAQVLVLRGRDGGGGGGAAFGAAEEAQHLTHL